MTHQRLHIVSVSWADHLAFGEGDGRLSTPSALCRRVERWREDLGAFALHWRMLRKRIPGRFQAADGYQHPSLSRTRDVTWDDFASVPRIAHDAGLQAHLYVSLFDEGWELPSTETRASSYHNAMHGQHVCWQSDFSRAHPEFTILDRTGTARQWGVLCLAYPEVRRHFTARLTDFIAGTDFDGLFVCLRSQSRPAEAADQFGFNEPIQRDFLERYGRDICRDPFDRSAWRQLCGTYVTAFLQELRAAVRRLGKTLSVGVPRGDVLGPPLGNAALEWREWIGRDLIDDLVINQNSSQCPSMWHQLWPMHRGSGYVQNYLDGTGLLALNQQIGRDYGPSLRGSAARLFVARQWDERDPEQEGALLNLPGVSGLVFSSFRFDNPAAIARGDWRA